MSTTIALRLTCPALWGGVMRVRNGLIYSDPQTARALIASKRARLDNPADIKLLLFDDPPRPPLGWQTRKEQTE